MLDTILFSVLPYAVIVTTIVAVTFRLRKRRFGVSSLSSQFLESGELFFGSVPWHYGILVVLTGHLIGFLVPRELLLFNSAPVRLYILEVTGLAFGLLSLVGIVSLIWRRASSPRIRAVTSRMDVLLLALLALQVVFGVSTAIFNRWGSSWYASSAVPYLWSVLALRPDPATIAPMPWTIKAHIVGFYLLLAILPFSRLIHALVPPLRYLTRPYELVIWYRRDLRPADRHARSRPAHTPRVRTAPPAPPSMPIVPEPKTPIAHEPTTPNVPEPTTPIAHETAQTAPAEELATLTPHE
ncbi:MAG TPA: respiratory nitrate reductase subunit gamma [Candidatus Kapabacteria bacterium]|jgi:nitrate reductase gamma subunit|nr:respiratory nitrate reductase subunit gamma [Candidatus Kapabacteria bacterium]